MQYDDFHETAKKENATSMTNSWRRPPGFTVLSEKKIEPQRGVFLAIVSRTLIKRRRHLLKPKM